MAEMTRDQLRVAISISQLEVVAERQARHAKLGERDLSDEAWVIVLTKEFADVTAAIDDEAALREALISAAATCAEWVESMDRRLTTVKEVMTS